MGPSWPHLAAMNSKKRRKPEARRPHTSSDLIRRQTFQPIWLLPPERRSQKVHSLGAFSREKPEQRGRRTKTLSSERVDNGIPLETRAPRCSALQRTPASRPDTRASEEERRRSPAKPRRWKASPIFDCSKRRWLQCLAGSHRVRRQSPQLREYRRASRPARRKFGRNSHCVLGKLRDNPFHRPARWEIHRISRSLAS